MDRDAIHAEIHALIDLLEDIMDSLDKSRGLSTPAEELDIAAIERRINNLRKRLDLPPRPRTIN
jgi:hypothetical protein